MGLPIEKLILHSRGQLVISGTRARSATMANFSLVRPAKVKHTLAVEGNGIAFGPREASGTFDVDISDEGPERDWIKDLLDGKIRNIIYEVPTVGIAFQCVWDKVDGKMPLDDAVSFTINWVGTIAGSPTA